MILKISEISLKGSVDSNKCFNYILKYIWYNIIHEMKNYIDEYM